MPNYNILDAEDGDIINTIIASEDFVSANYDFYQEVTTSGDINLTAEETARQWRDMELASTDTAAQTPDWPNRDNILTYRAALRDWPSTSNFPATKPTLGE